MEDHSITQLNNLRYEYERHLSRVDNNITHLLDMVTLDLEEYIAFEEERNKFFNTFKPHYYSLGGKCFPSHGQLSDFLEFSLEMRVEVNRSRHLLKDIASWDAYHYSNIKLHIMESEDSFYAVKYSDLITLKHNSAIDTSLFKEMLDITNMHRVFEESFCNDSPGYWRSNCVRYVILLFTLYLPLVYVTYINKQLISLQYLGNGVNTG